MIAEICIESGITSAVKPKDGYGGFIVRQDGQEIVKIGTIRQANDKYSHLLCLKNALLEINTKCDAILIHTSLPYIYFNLVSTNFTKWERNSWKNAKGEDIPYKKEWQIVADCLKGKKMRVELNREYKNKSDLRSAIREKMKKSKIAPVQANG